jgi:transcription factor C subunit 6
MPSLRDRSKRPSYALLAEGLDNLSDDDRDSDASHAEGSQAGARRRAKSQSSESTDFNPAVKGKGKGKGKAESGSEFEGASSEEEEEDDMEDDAVDEVEQEEEDDKPEELDEDDELVALDSPPAKAPPRPRPPPIFTNAASHSNQATYITSDTNLIPLHYRQLIVKHSEIIAAPIRGKPTVASKERDYKARSLDPIAMPHGPGTPFVTRLKKEVKGREAAEVIYDQELGRDPVEAQDKYKRQRHSANVVKNVTLTAPWEVWQGEGWWPEMAPGHPVSSRFLNSDGKGAAAGVPAPKPKGIPKTAEGWTMRADVRLGSDDVGRYSIGQMEFLSKE